MRERLPEAYDQLLETAERLERHYRDMQDVEFTVEEGTLYLLQTRTAKRTAAAALKCAVDMVSEGLISREEAVARIDPAQLDQLLHPMIDPAADFEVAARGLNASPGAASGAVVLDADRAAERGAAGESVILVGWETTPDDIHGMIQAKGVLTAHGGMTSHAAVVARGMGKPCVAGCDALSIDLEARTARIGEHAVAEGDVITINGGTGDVILGEVPLVPPQINEDFQTVLEWADGLRRLSVRANADTPEDSAKAREFGAEGIGLCRTEHMFFGSDREEIVRDMFIAAARGRQGADPESALAEALDRLGELQRQDFAEIFRAMSGLPVTVRLLDPPMHEFVSAESFARELERARESGDAAELERVEGRIAVAEELGEVNPMLGTRGARLGLLMPALYEMQVRAIVRAALEAGEESEPAAVEIMIPLVAYEAELAQLRRLVVDTAKRTADMQGATIQCAVGTMIELPRACLIADELATDADFFSFGSNDLTQTTIGLSRDDAERELLPLYLGRGIFARSPFETIDVAGVGSLVRTAVERGRSTKPELTLGICGEHGGDPASIEFFSSVSLDYVSCSPYRVPIARVAAAQAAS
jgi:pyruvate,orthophosphate dikinase